MQTYYITVDEIDSILEKAGSQFLSVQFTKKSTGEVRNILGHLKVQAYLAGGESTIKNHPNLVSIWELSSKSYKCFDKNYVIKIRIAGNTYRIIKDNNNA